MRATTKQILNKKTSSRTTFLPSSRTKKTCGATYYETNESCRDTGTTSGDVDALIAIRINDGVFDVTALDLHLEVLDELDQEPVPLFDEKLGSQIRKLLIRRYVVNAHVSLLDDLTNIEITQSHVFSTRAVGLVSGYV